MRNTLLKVFVRCLVPNSCHTSSLVPDLRILVCLPISDALPSPPTQDHSPPPQTPGWILCRTFQSWVHAPWLGATSPTLTHRLLPQYLFWKGATWLVMLLSMAPPHPILTVVF